MEPIRPLRGIKWAMSHFSLLLLDLDDTVVEFSRARRSSFVRTAEEYRLPVDGQELYAEFCRASDRLWAGHREGKTSLEQVRTLRFAEVLKPFAVNPVEFTKRFYEIISTAEEVMPGAVESIRALASVFKLVGISNGRRETQELRMAHVGLKDCFSFFVGPEDCGFAKPHPALFLLALERAGGVPRERALVVGDGLETDIQGAAALGIASCWLNPEGLERAPEDPVPTIEVPSLVELTEKLLG